MSINQSQPRMRLTQSSFIADFTKSQQRRPVFGLFGARVFAARLAGCTRSVLHPCTPHLRREFPKRRVSFPIFPTHKNNDLPSLPHLQRDLHSTHRDLQRNLRDLQRDLHRDTHTTIPTPPRPASSGGPQLCFHFNYLNPNYHAAAGERFMVEALKKELAGRSRSQRSHWGAAFWRRAFSRRFRCAQQK